MGWKKVLFYSLLSMLLAALESAAAEPTPSQGSTSETPSLERLVCEVLERNPEIAAALLITERGLRRIMGYRDLWMLKAALDHKGALVHEEAA